MEGALDVCLWFVARLNKIIKDLMMLRLSIGFGRGETEQPSEALEIC